MQSILRYVSRLRKKKSWTENYERVPKSLDENVSIDYVGRWQKVKINKHWFKILPGDRLTAVPIVKPKRFSFWYVWWLQLTPEWYKTRVRLRSHQRFLKKFYNVPDLTRRWFGTEFYIETEKKRVCKLPLPEWNDFDPKWPNRHISIRAHIHAAIHECSRQGQTTRPRRQK